MASGSEPEDDDDEAADFEDEEESDDELPRTAGSNAGEGALCRRYMQHHHCASPRAVRTCHAPLPWPMHMCALLLLASVRLTDRLPCAFMVRWSRCTWQSKKFGTGFEAQAS
jgi:hypothetical protein